MKSLVFGLAVIFGGLVAGNVHAQGYVDGMNFIVTHNTSINEIGAYDGGTAFTTDEYVGIFNDATGNLVGPDIEFGPGAAAAGITGTQIGNTYFENTAAFLLTPGEYSIITIGAGVPTSGNAGLAGAGNSLDLAGDVYSLPASDGTQFQSASYALHDPPAGVPDGGMTVLLLGASLTGLGWFRRKI
ncbi:MAG TPA: hypothetical protein VH595_15730 [Verrucomicrobiae bacterium]|jgi:hypothetical protein|nr:hypothetical protein [Verrucomicrobiae bacterium]